MRGIAIGDVATHPKRGAGVVVAINPENDGRIHIEFENTVTSEVEVHRYKQSSWHKFKHVNRNGPAAAMEHFSARKSDAEVAIAAGRFAMFRGFLNAKFVGLRRRLIIGMLAEPIRPDIGSRVVLKRLDGKPHDPLDPEPTQFTITGRVENRWQVQREVDLDGLSPADLLDDRLHRDMFMTRELVRCFQVSSKVATGPNGEDLYTVHDLGQVSFRAAFGRIQGFMVFYMYGLYPDLVATIASMWLCEEIAGTRYLSEDYSVQCWKGWHLVYAAVAGVAFAFYAIGIPVAIFIILRSRAVCLWCKKGKLSRRDKRRWFGMKRTDPIFVARFGFIFSGYHTDRGWIVAWEALVMCRKLIVTIIAVGIAEDPYIQVCYSLFSTESMTEYSCNLMILCPPA